MTTHAGHLRGSSARSAPARRATRSRAADRAARRAFRSRRVWPALVAGLLLAAGGVLAAIEVISALANGPSRIVDHPRVTDWAARTPWDDWVPMAIAAGVALLGLIFLLAGLVPGRGRVVPLRSDRPDLLMGITRSGLKSAVSAAAEEVDGVTGVRKVRVGRRKVTVRAATAMRSEDGLEDAVRAAVRDRLDQLRPLPKRRVAVRISPRRD